MNSSTKASLTPTSIRQIRRNSRIKKAPLAAIDFRWLSQRRDTVNAQLRYSRAAAMNVQRFFVPFALTADERHPYARCVDRKSVVEGKSVSVRVNLGGRRIIKKKQLKNIVSIIRDINIIITITHTIYALYAT